ncbi:MAG TPA: serine/threonine-protein kinase [Micromonosporaceae bacterium]
MIDPAGGMDPADGMDTLGGRYRLLEQIGTGGMARVWRAYDEVLARPVAVKLLGAEDDRDSRAFDRARTEARCAGRLAHPNVAAVYDFGTSRRGGRGVPYLVMELVEGPLLSDYLRRGVLHPATAVRVCAEVSAGLAAAHAHGIVHRDIKPTNVVLTQSGAKILDFGIAARTGEPDLPEDGWVVGTPAYMAPERMDGHPITPALDMYSLGIVLYRCLTATLPWSADNDTDMLRAHYWQDPAPLPVIAGLDDDAARICMACLCTGPDERPTAAAAALILAATIDAQVYLPAVPRPMPAAGPASDPPVGNRTDAELDGLTTRYRRQRGSQAGAA